MGVTSCDCESTPLKLVQYAARIGSDIYPDSYYKIVYHQVIAPDALKPLTLQNKGVVYDLLFILTAIPSLGLVSEHTGKML